MQPRSASGRPRDARIDPAVLDATLAVLASTGYRRLTLEEVARQAGTTKPAIYRRWAGRERLVLAALARELGELDTPDTGCSICDLGECLSVFIGTFRRLPPDVLGPLYADCAGTPELRSEFMAALFDPPRSAVARTITRARDRGDLRADLDVGLTLDLIGAFVHYRVLFGHASTDVNEIAHVVETLLHGIATDYPALLARSLELEAAARAEQTHHLHRAAPER